jgi:hypothetical protein
VIPAKQAAHPRGESRMPGDIVFVRMVGVVTNARDIDQAEGAHRRISSGRAGLRGQRKTKIDDGDSTQNRTRPKDLRAVCVLANTYRAKRHGIG